jgi:HSP20 family protein
MFHNVLVVFMVKKPRFPSFFDDDFPDVFGDMGSFHDMFDELMKKSMHGLSHVQNQPGKPLVYGFSMHVGPDGKPRVEQFGNVQKGKVSNEREPLVDVLDGVKEVRVLAELPGVEKKDIHMDSIKGVLHLRVSDADRPFAKDVRLPMGTDEKSAKATYKNGILDVVFKKKAGHKKNEISVG